MVPIPSQPPGLPRMPTVPVDHGRRDARDNRQKIIAAAERLFSVHGVSAVSMNQIAKAAGVGAGTLYRHFPDKGALALRVAIDDTLRLERDVLGRLDATPGEALDDLSWFVQQLLEFSERVAPLLGAVVPRPHSPYAGPLWAWAHQIATHLLQRAHKEGRLADLDPEWTADTLLAGVAPDLFLYQHERRGWPAERMRAAASSLVESLRRPASSRH